MDVEILKAALTAYLAQLDKDTRAIRRATVQEGLDGREAAEQIKEIEGKRLRAIKARRELKA